ncbi:MAG: hypothetical protein JRJ59_13695 [Deltaproteobacteria bacterium]|nr:hypothetical protein [Deltaproteobacteria bacterium]
MIKRIIISLFILLVGGSYFAFKFCRTSLEDDEIGVRVNNIPYFHKVYGDNITEAGDYFTFPKLLVIYRIPKTAMSIDMAEEHSNGDKISILKYDARTENESVRVKTADGNDVWVELIVKFQVAPVSAHKALMNIGLKRGDIKKDLENLVNSMTRGVVRARLASLNSEEIQNGELLTKKIDRAKEDLDKKLFDFGIDITALSWQRVKLHKDYQQVWNDKIKANEDAAEAIERAKKLVIQVETNRLRAEGAANAMIEVAKGRKARVLQEAKAEEDALKQNAQAMKVKYEELAKGLADLTRELAATGGDQHIGLAIAQALQGKKIIIVPAQGSMNLLDVNEILQSYGAARMLKGDAADAPEAAGKEAAAKTDDPGAVRPVSAKDEPETGKDPEVLDTKRHVEEVTGPELTTPKTNGPDTELDPADSRPGK